MSVIKSIGLATFLMLTNLTNAQEWGKTEHRSYIDSLDEHERTLGAPEYNELLFRGLNQGAEKYPDEHLDYLFSIINNFFRQSQRDSMQVYMDIAFDVIDTSKEDEIWRWYVSKGNYYYDIPQLDSTKYYYLKSLESARRNAELDKVAGLLNNLASACLNLTELDTAEILVQESLHIGDSLGFTRVSMNSNVLLANIHTFRNDLAKAATYYSEAYDASKKGGLGVSHVYNSYNMGRLFLRLGQYEESIKYFKEALVESKRFNQKRTIGAVYILYADVMLLSGDYTGAQKLMMEVDAESVELTGLVHQLHKILLAKLALNENDPIKARSILKKTFNDDDDYERFVYRTDLFLCKADIAYRLNDLDRAENMCARGVKDYRSRLITGIQLFELQSEILENRKKYRGALAANRDRNALADSLVSLNQIGINLIQEIKKDLSQSEIAMNDLAEDYAEIEFQKQRQVNVIIGLIAGIISLAIFSFFYSRNRKLQLEKDLTDVKQQLLRIQINPHFIFNVLNSIQSSFLLEDQEKTIYLFNKFSNLMRQVLENSTSSFIPLNQELELLINYMEIEKGRTNNKFDYKVDIDGEVDIYLEEVPTMVLQIFVENSIWHGVVPKENRGLISLQISKEENILKIAIVDDGVGRSFSLSHKSKDQREKKSLGTDLVLQRLQLLNRKFGRNIGIAIGDGPNSLGTRVELAV